LSARVAYERAAAATPREDKQLRSASETLDQAEYVYEQDGNTQQARALSLLARQRAERVQRRPR
jgi:hypothetical protein